VFSLVLSSLVSATYNSTGIDGLIGFAQDASGTISRNRLWLDNQTNFTTKIYNIKRI